MHGFLRPFAENLYHFAPIPLYYRELSAEEVHFADLNSFNAQLISVARQSFTEMVLDVPDERHADTLGRVPDFPAEPWAEPHPTAVGIWHAVPTNQFLAIEHEAVARLRAIVETAYVHTLAQQNLDDGRRPQIAESWIQFYKQGDRKVLHNHERYAAPFYDRMWAGAYYLHDGDPDPTMKYAGVFSFEVRGTHYYVRPKPGLLMMWPADILHEVHPFYGASERVVINFNINLEPVESTSKVEKLLRRVMRRLA